MILFGIARFVAAGALLAVIGDATGDYHTLAHLVACVVAVYGAFQSHQLNAGAWAWTFGVVAVVFYPLLPLNLPPFDSAIIDLGGAVVMVLSLGSRTLRH